MASETNELTFVRCPTCRSLVPASASRCRICNATLEVGGKVASSDGHTQASRVRQKTVSAGPEQVDNIIASGDSMAEAAVSQPSSSPQQRDVSHEAIIGKEPGKSPEDIFDPLGEFLKDLDGNDSFSEQKSAKAGPVADNSGIGESIDDGESDSDEFDLDIFDDPAFDDLEDESTSSSKSKEIEDLDDDDDGFEEIMDLLADEPNEFDLEVKAEAIKQGTADVSGKLLAQPIEQGQMVAHAQESPQGAGPISAPQRLVPNPSALSTRRDTVAPSRAIQAAPTPANHTLSNTTAALGVSSGRTPVADSQTEQLSRGPRIATPNNKDLYRERGNSQQSIGRQSLDGAQSPRANKMKPGRLFGWLVSYENPDGRAIELRAGRFFITGTSIRETDLILEDQSISTPHALMSITERGLQIQDLMSERGTFVRSDGDEQYRREDGIIEIRHGDWIRFGDVEFLITIVPA